jgi:hypothetical protein
MDNELVYLDSGKVLRSERKGVQRGEEEGTDIEDCCY